MGDTFSERVRFGQIGRAPSDPLTRCRTLPIRKRVSSDRTRRPIEDVSCKHIYRGGHMTRSRDASESGACQGAPA